MSSFSADGMANLSGGAYPRHIAITSANHHEEARRCLWTATIGTAGECAVFRRLL